MHGTGNIMSEQSAEQPADTHVTAQTLTSFLWVQLGADIDGEMGSDTSGQAVSLNAAGDRVAVGAPYNNGPGDNTGHVRVYEYAGSAWIQLGADIDGEADWDRSGESVSLNAAGDRVAIGASNHGVAGYVRVYEYASSAWTQLVDGEAAGDYSGSSVSLNDAGNRVAIGARWNDGAGDYAGHVRVYEYASSAWIQLGADIDGEAAGDYSGSSVSLNAAGDRVAIGAPRNFGAGIVQAGHVRVYEYADSSWIQLGADIDGEAAYDRSGRSVSLNGAGNRVAIGAPYNDGAGASAGHGRVYEYASSSWIQLGADIDGEGEGDYFGESVSLNGAGDRVAIGAPYHGTTSIGLVRMFEYTNSFWTQLGADIDGEAAEDHCGESVSVNDAGDRVAAGAPRNDGNGYEAGHARVNQLLAEPTGVPTSSPTSPSASPSDSPTSPSASPSDLPTSPSVSPTAPPSVSPTAPPSVSPSATPSVPPTSSPSDSADSPSTPPTEPPSAPPSEQPTFLPTTLQILQDSGDNDQIAVIGGIAGGAGALLCLCGLLVFFFCAKKTKNLTAVPTEESAL